MILLLTSLILVATPTNTTYLPQININQVSTRQYIVDTGGGGGGATNDIVHTCALTSGGVAKCYIRWAG